MRIALLLPCFLLACGSAPERSSDAGPDAFGHKDFDAAAMESDAPVVVPVDCDAGSTPSSTYPAPHPALPFAKSAGGPTMAHPRIVPIVFAGEDRTTDIGAFAKSIGGSSYWNGIVAQYGVGPATAVDPVVVNETPSASISDGDIIAWLKDKLDGTHTDFGAPDPNAIYVVYYPQATTITTSWGQSCTMFGGYHSETKVGTTPIVYAVIARCPNGVFSMTGITSHELFEAVTDPYIYSATAYNALDDDGTLENFQDEIGDLCEGNPEIFSSELGHPVARIWSNVASLAARDPCQPNGATPYFQTIADAPGPGRSVKLAAGGTITVNLVAFSDADTGGPWDVKVTASWGTLADKLSLSLCRTSARNGETIPLTITRPDTSTSTNWITIESTLNGVSTFSSLFVDM